MSLRNQLFALSALALACATLPAHASTVDLAFVGEYHLDVGTNVFGIPGEYVPFNYQMKFDTDKNEHFVHILAGQVIQGNTTAAYDLFGYSASTIVSSNIKIGSQVYRPEQLSERSLGGGFGAQIWFDRDISQGLPTKVWMMFDASDMDSMHTMQIGGGYQDASDAVQLYNIASLDYINFHNGDYTSAFTSNMQIAAIPEPETYAMMGMGLLALGALQKRRAAKA